MLGNRRDVLKLMGSGVFLQPALGTLCAARVTDRPGSRQAPPWFQYFPEQPAWSFFILRLIKQAPKGGTEFNEIYRAIRQIRAGDASSWAEAWLELARHVESLGETASRNGQCVTARDSFRRAANYYFAAQATPSRSAGRSVKKEMADRAMACFARAAAFFGPSFEWVKIPYGNASLEGYLFSAGAEQPGVLIRVDQNGPWIFSEVLWAAEYGLSTLVCHERGSQDSGRQGSLSPPDFEVPVRAMIDYLEGKRGADRARIALVGLSDLSAHYCLRAAAFEKRVRAVACIDGWYDLSEMDPALLERAGVMAGLRSGAEGLRSLRDYSLKGILRQVKCPVLICYTAGDPEVDAGAIEKIYAELGGPKELRRWAAADHVLAHNGVDNPFETVPFILDWLRLRLGLREACPSPGPNDMSRGLEQSL